MSLDKNSSLVSPISAYCKYQQEKAEKIEAFINFHLITQTALSFVKIYTINKLEQQK